MTIRCRKSDSDLVKKAKDEASKDFKENAGFDIKLEIAEDLPEESYVYHILSSSSLHLADDFVVYYPQSWRCNHQGIWKQNRH